MYTFHRFFFAFMRVLVRFWFGLTGHYRCPKYSPRSKPSLILTNHNTNWDFFYFGAPFRGHMYFVASEHIFRLGFVSRLIRFLADPIARKKGASSQETIDEIKRRLAKGQNVCMMAEGNRSFTGETGFISPMTARLAKECGAGLITFRLHGGYFVNPRWSKETRKGKVWGELGGQYSPEELSAMTEEEVAALIERDLFVDAFADQRKMHYTYKAKAPAETLETALFACPDCKAFARLRSHGNRLTCDACGGEHVLTDEGFFARPDGSAPAFETIAEWSEWQKGHLQKRVHEMQASKDVSPIRSDEGAKLYRVHPLEGKSLIAEGTVRLYTDRLEVGGDEDRPGKPVSELQKDLLTIGLDSMKSMAVILVNTILFTAGEEYYELRLSPRASALQYLIAYFDLKGKEYKR